MPSKATLQRVPRGRGRLHPNGGFISTLKDFAISSLLGSLVQKNITNVVIPGLGFIPGLISVIPPNILGSIVIVPARSGAAITGRVSSYGL